MRGALETNVGDVYVQASKGKLRYGDVTVPFDTGDELTIDGQNLRLKHAQDGQVTIDGLSREVSLNGVLRSRSIWSVIPVDVRTVLITIAVSSIPLLWRKLKSL